MRKRLVALLALVERRSTDLWLGWMSDPDSRLA
jgi:hypothetical protein